MSECDLPAAMISLDWSETFDRVSIGFVLQVLEWLGFPPPCLWVGFICCIVPDNNNGLLLSSFVNVFF